jgi:hypothetical protein
MRDQHHIYDDTERDNAGQHLYVHDRWRGFQRSRFEQHQHYYERANRQFDGHRAAKKAVSDEWVCASGAKAHQKRKALSQR